MNSDDILYWIGNFLALGIFVGMIDKHGFSTAFATGYVIAVLVDIRRAVSR